VTNVRWATPRALVLAVVLSMCAQLVSTGVMLWTSTHNRRENCERVQEAFDKYTDALAAVAGADPDTVQDFRAAYRPALAECS
jgi:uncharacterized membrane protein